MSDTVLLALIVGFFGLLTTYFTARAPERMARLTAEANAATIKAANVRADEVATRVSAVATQTAKAADLLVESNAKVAASTREIKEQVSATHTLVNSDKTEGIQQQLDDARIMLALMIEVVRLNKVAGQEPSIESLAAIEMTKSKIVDRERQLADRLAATKAVEMQQAISNSNKEHGDED